MELFIPSLVVLLLGVAIAFFLLPRLAPTILIGGSAAVLALALYLHYSRFGRMEYQQSTWQYNLKQFSGWIMFAAVLLGAYGFYAINAGSAPAGGGEPMPPLALPQAGGGFKNVANTAMGRIHSLLRHGRIN